MDVLSTLVLDGGRHEAPTYQVEAVVVAETDHALADPYVHDALGQHVDGSDEDFDD